jgi:hypothetical protein
LNNLAFARNGWDDRVDHQALLDGYLSGMFGSAAGEIKPIFERMIAALKRVEREGPAVSQWLSPMMGQKRLGAAFFLTATQLFICSRVWALSFWMRHFESLGPEFLDAALQRAREKASDARERRQVETSPPRVPTGDRLRRRFLWT